MGNKILIVFILVMKACAIDVVAQWTQVGGNIGSTTFHNPSLAFHPSTNEAYIAYPDTAVFAYVVKKFDGTNWVQVGGSLGYASSEAPSLAFDPSTNEPYIAYLDPVASAYLVQKFSGTNWIQVGSGLGPATYGSPVLAFHPSSNEAYIGYGQSNGDPYVVKKFNGTAWTQVGSNVGAISNGTPSMAFQPVTNEIYMAYPDILSWGGRVEKFNGTNWTAVGPTRGAGSYAVPSIAFHPSTNEVYAAYFDGVNNTFMVVKFNGSSWVMVGTSFGNGQNARPRLVFHPSTNEPYVTYSNTLTNNVEVHKYNGTNWVQVGASLSSPPTVGYSIPSLVFDPSSNEAYVAYFGSIAKAFVVKKYICNSTFGTDLQTSCGPFLWIDGNTYSASNNTASYTLTSSAGCDSIVTLDLTINSVNSNVTQSGNSLVADLAGAVYQWMDCDNNYAIIPGATNQSFSPSGNGNYAVAITQNGCSDTSACFAVTVVNVVGADFKDRLLLYPNPTNGNFSIDLGSNYESITAKIYDVNGRIIQSKMYHDVQRLNLSLENTAGIYSLMLESEGKQAVFRVIKE